MAAGCGTTLIGKDKDGSFTFDWDSEKIYSEYKSKGINTPYTNEELTGSPRAIVTGEKITE